MRIFFGYLIAFSFVAYGFFVLYRINSNMPIGVMALIVGRSMIQDVDNFRNSKRGNKK